MCLHPLKAWVVPGVKSVNGKRVFSFTHIDAPFCYHYPDAKDYEIISCGRCAECRIQRAREWSVRCCSEAALYPENTNWFVTCTYDDYHLPVCHWSDVVTGEYIGQLPNLSKKDFQDFIDRLRSYFSYHFGSSGIRFFGCGEFGGRRGRSHYHYCFFNTPLELLGDWSYNKPYSHSDLGYPLFHSDKLDSLWGKGLVLFSQNTPETSAYTARYTLKKAGQPGQTLYYQLKYRAKTDPHCMQLLQDLNYRNLMTKRIDVDLSAIRRFKKRHPALAHQYVKELYRMSDGLRRFRNRVCVNPPEGQQVEFVGMSKNPGLGYHYFMSRPDELAVMDEIWSTGSSSHLPSYFKKLYENFDSELDAFLRDERHQNFLEQRAIVSEAAKIDSWQHDVLDLKSGVVESYKKAYKRGDY